MKFTMLLAVFESKYRVWSVNLRVSSEADEGVEVSGGNDDEEDDQIVPKSCETYDSSIQKQLKSKHRRQR